MESLYAAAGLATSCGLILYLFYCWLLPKPIPGRIPYHQLSANRLFGDIPEMIQSMGDTKDPLPWFAQHGRSLNSPISQAWIKIFQRPIVIVSDPVVAEDILVHRNRDWDRGPMFKDIFEPQLPFHHVSLSTNDQFRAQRRLIKDAITPKFIRESAEPAAQEAADCLFQRWRSKLQLSDEKCFEAGRDILEVVVGELWNLSSGQSMKHDFRTSAELKVSQSGSQKGFKTDVAEFVTPETSQLVTEAQVLTQVVQTLVSSPSPRLHHYYLKLFPRLRAAYKYKDDMLEKMYQDSTRRTKGEKLSDPKSAMDYFVASESGQTGQIGNISADKVIKDEVYGFIQAGHDTTATTFMWVCKYLTAYPEWQAKIRSTIQSVCPNTPASMHDEIPELDAFIEEVLRCCLPAGVATREAIHDTEILGHYIPAGTEVYMPFAGPGYLSPALHIPADQRSEKMKNSYLSGCTWEPDTLNEFRPARWIDPVSGRYNPMAGSMPAFGAGIRGCWGKKLAYSTLRVFTSALLLNFELEPVSEDLNSFTVEMRFTREPKFCYVRLRELS